MREGYRTEVKVSASGQMRGGVLYSRGMLYRLLTNPIYRGMIVHKGEAFSGEHEAIVSQELLYEVQARMLGRTQGHSRRMKAKNPSLPAGLLLDGEGRAMTPSHSLKGKVRYRYYSTRPELIDGSEAWRVSAHDVEALVCERLAALLEDLRSLGSHLPDRALSARQTSDMIDAGVRLAEVIRGGSPSDRLHLIEKLVELVALQSEQIVIRTDTSRLFSALGLGCKDDAQSDLEPAPIPLECPAAKAWHGRQLRLIIPGPASESNFRHRDPKLVRLMSEVNQARELVLANADQTVSEIARRAGRCRIRLDRLLKLACLAPSTVTALLEGRQPVGLSNTTLLSATLPLDWADQRALFGFA